MAIIHPITYLRLRNEKGDTVGSISIGCVWLLCGGKLIFLALPYKVIIVDLLLVIMSFTIIFFCGFSISCALIRPRPREGRRPCIDKSKLRAFFTITTILATLILRLLWNTFAAYTRAVQREKTDCALILSGCGFNLSSSFVLSLLFLHRLRA